MAVNTALPSADNTIAVANAALLALGSRPIERFSDKTSSARIVRAAFNNVLEQALSAYPWRFARATLPIFRVAHHVRIAEWDFSYGWPVKALAVHEVWDHKAGQPVKFDVSYDAVGPEQGRRIMTNTPPVVRQIRHMYISGPIRAPLPGEELIDEGNGNYTIITKEHTLSAECTVMVGPAAWPGYFRQAFIHLLAAEICLAITSDHAIEQVMRQRGASEMQYAKTRDAQSRTPPRIDTGLILRARRGR